MKFAFSTLTCPRWDFPTVAARAREYGFDGVELVAPVADPRDVRTAFESAGVEIACVSGPVVWTGRRREDARQSDLARSLIRLACELGCERVAVCNTRLRRGHSAAAAGVELGDRLLPLADLALARGVMLLVENAPGLRAAKDVWALLDRLRHPALACCWDPLNAALAGETPALSVPTLNSRIRFARVRDARLAPAGPGFCGLGQGDVGIERFVARLRGIGYDGYLTAAWEAARLPEGTAPEAWLAEGLARLKAWSAPPVSPASKPGQKGAPRAGRKSDAAPAGG